MNLMHSLRKQRVERIFPNSLGDQHYLDIKPVKIYKQSTDKYMNTKILTKYDFMTVSSNKYG